MYDALLLGPETAAVSASTQYATRLPLAPPEQLLPGCTAVGWRVWQAVIVRLFCCSCCLLHEGCLAQAPAAFKATGPTLHTCAHMTRLDVTLHNHQSAQQVGTTSQHKPSAHKINAQRQHKRSSLQGNAQRQHKCSAHKVSTSGVPQKHKQGAADSAMPITAR